MSEALRAQIEARNAEKAAIVAEITRQEPVIAEVQGRLTAARRKVADAQNRLSALRSERAQIEQRFARRVGTRSEGVEDARRQLRAAMVAFAHEALSDESNFGAEFGEARADIARVQYAQRKAERDVKLHEAAIATADPKKVTQGIVVAAAVVLAPILVIIITLIARAPSEPSYTAPASSATSPVRDPSASPSPAPPSFAPH